MLVIVEAVWISLVQLVLFTYCGWPATWLMLPAAMRPYSIVLAPLGGLALLAVAGFYGSNAGLALPWVLAGLLIGATLATLVALRAGAVCDLARLPWRELLPLAVLMVGAWLLGVAPTLHYGTLMPIGHGLDSEFYMALVDYLKTYSYPTLASAPPNPLRELLRSAPIVHIAFGATYAQGMADLLAGSRAWTSWTPMLALLRALLLPALYLLLRLGLGATPLGALAGAGLAAANGLLLWAAYNSFGASLAGLALLPAALLLTLLAIEYGGRWTIAGAALLVGGLTCLYWPILTAYGALGLGPGLALLWRYRHGDWPGVVGRAAAVLGLGGLVGLLPHLRAPQAFPGLFAAETPFMGITSFVAPAVFAGSALFAHPAVAADGILLTILATAGLLAALLLLVNGVWRGVVRRDLALGLALCGAVYLLGLRFVVGYPYGFFRGGSYVAPLLLGLAGAGAWPVGAPRRIRLYQAAFPALFAGLALAVTLTAYRGYALYAGGPAGYSRATAALAALPDQLEDPGAVFFSSAAATRLCGPSQGAWSYWLQERELQGTLAATFTRLANPRTAQMPAYGVLEHGEDPTDHGFAATPVWQNATHAVYPAPAGRLAWLSGQTGYAAEPLCGRSSSAERAALGLSDYRVATPDQSLRFSAGAATLAWAALPPEATQTRELQLALASFTPQTVELTFGTQTRQVALPAGLSVYATGALATPLEVALRPADGPLFLVWLALEAQPGDTRLTTDAQTLLVAPATTAQPAGARIDLRLANPSDQALRMAFEAYEDVRGYTTPPAHDWRVLTALPPAGMYQFDINIDAATFFMNGAELPVTTGERRRGDYFAALWLYQGEQVVQRIPLFQYTRSAETVTTVAPHNSNLALVRLRTVEQPAAAQFEGGVEMRGYTPGPPIVAPGADLTVSLLWQAQQADLSPLLVFVQLLAADERKIAQWDGAAGGWLPTSAWRPGLQVWQDVPLTVAADAPPGRYRLIMGLYDPATGARLPLVGGSDAVELGEVIVK